MAYTKQTWVNNETLVDEDRMNHIENGIYQNAEDISEINQSLTYLGANYFESFDALLAFANSLPRFQIGLVSMSSTVATQLKCGSSLSKGMIINARNTTDAFDYLLWPTTGSRVIAGRVEDGVLINAYQYNGTEISL